MKLAIMGDTECRRVAMYFLVGVLGVQSTIGVQDGVQVSIGSIGKHEVTLMVTKVNSTAQQVTTNISRMGDVSEFHQMSLQFNASMPEETREIQFTQLTHDQEYRVCSSETNAEEAISDIGCFQVTTFPYRSMTKGIITAVIASSIFVLVVGALCFGYRTYRRRKHSKTMVVTSTNGSNGVVNRGSDVPEA